MAGCLLHFPAPATLVPCLGIRSGSFEASRLCSPFRIPFTNGKSCWVVPKAMRENGVEPDLQDGPIDIHATAGEDEEHLFPYGDVDGAHSWHEGDDGTFWEGIQEVISSAGGPTGGQAVISWLFFPGFFTGLAFKIQVEYLFLYTVLFIFAFIGIEMAKKDDESNYIPEIYNE